MPIDREAILAAALELPESDKAWLADRLLETLGEEFFELGPTRVVEVGSRDVPVLDTWLASLDENLAPPPPPRSVTEDASPPRVRPR